MRKGSKQSERNYFQSLNSEPGEVGLAELLPYLPPPPTDKNIVLSHLQNIPEKINDHYHFQNT